MARLYKAADVYVAPYHGEGWHMPAVEAMASGIPRILTAGGAAAEAAMGSYGSAHEISAAGAGALLLPSQLCSCT